MNQSKQVFGDQADLFDDFRDRKNHKYLQTLIRNGDAIKTLVRKMARYAQEKNLPLEAIKPTTPSWAGDGRLVIYFQVDPDYIATIEQERQLSALS